MFYFWNIFILIFFKVFDEKRKELKEVCRSWLLRVKTRKDVEPALAVSFVYLFCFSFEVSNSSFCVTSNQAPFFVEHYWLKFYNKTTNVYFINFDLDIIQFMYYNCTKQDWKNTWNPGKNFNLKNFEKTWNF